MRPLAFTLACLLISPVFAGPTVDLAAEASLPAANDLLRATVYVEAQNSDAAELAKRVNQDLSEALRLIKRSPEISVKTGNQQTYPIYAKDRRIESWRMHSELLLESKDAAKFSETLGRLQQMKVALGSISQSPSEATRREVEEAATREAIKAFERRAEVVAQSLKKTYRIKSLNIQQAGSQPPIMPMRSNRALLMSADAAPAPVEAGESLLTVNINGQIELSD